MEYFACRLSDLEENKSHVFIVNGKEVAVVLLDDKVYAYRNHCPHAGGPVGLGELFPRVKVELGENQEVIREYVDENEMCLVCPWHGFEFEAKTGQCIPEKAMKLRKYETEIKDDSVYIYL
ncbi:Rieske (2Fe-2S) protein [Bacillus sp. Marseille-P3661]|uniref:Rieske (2Fe-2S) protein n=1 Tax=Bacillus sp. Marseille-P3661 TaxID=1936234 RepID=UPI000C842A6F|nr:Rieske (2Fe-2S) protein [Bacillus sp. Marseille-P3661]